MLDQSDNLYHYYLVVLLFQIYICSINSISSFKFLLYIFQKFDIIIYKQGSNLSIKFSIIYLKCFRSCLCFCHSRNRWIIIWISRYCMQYLDNDKSSSISKLINDKSRDLQKLFKCFNGTTTSAFNLLSLSGVLPVIFVLYLKDLLITILFLFIL